jgi:hypothetical protein
MYHTEIHIKGKLHPSWSDWFDELQIRANFSGDTILYGNLPDKSAVYGVLSRLSSLGMTLVSVTCHEEIYTGPPTD